MVNSSEIKIKEFGDFQTPKKLATIVTQKIKMEGANPKSILEPTCGIGAFVISALDVFPTANIHGIDINSSYLKEVKNQISKPQDKKRVFLDQADFFTINWNAFIEDLPKPILILGNLPWVTSSELGLIEGNNLPEKRNIHGLRGLDSITGKSNFDISEYMLLTLLEALNFSSGTIAILCKVSVARKVFSFLSKERFTDFVVSISKIDAKKYFNVTVDACLFVCHINLGKNNTRCQVFSSLIDPKPETTLAVINGTLVNDYTSYQELEPFIGNSSLTWRSGIKHDAAKIMEIKAKNDHYINGFNEKVDLEEIYLFPLLKSSDIFHNRVSHTQRWLITPQDTIGKDTNPIKDSAPKTWAYLNQYKEILDKRASSIYLNKPRFSIFGVGPYTFSSWKVAISGFYKQPIFRLIGPIDEKPVVFDDTCYFLPASSKEEAILLFLFLDHPIVSKILDLFIYREAKRPITKNLLQQVNLHKLAKEINEDYIKGKISSLNMSFDGLKVKDLHLKMYRQG